MLNKTDINKFSKIDLDPKNQNNENNGFSIFIDIKDILIETNKAFFIRFNNKGAGFGIQRKGVELNQLSKNKESYYNRVKINAVGTYSYHYYGMDYGQVIINKDVNIITGYNLIKDYKAFKDESKQKN